MDRFAALSAFVAVVEQGGFAPAARRLGVAPSSLTRQLNALEEQLGTRLMSRSTRHVTLTEEGSQYYEDARRILEELANADNAVGELSGPPAGLLRVALPVAFGRLHVGPALPGFLREFPGIRLDVHQSDAMVNLIDERMDVAIRLGSTAAPHLVARKLGAHNRVICASPDYLAQHGVPVVPGDLARHNCLLFDYLTGTSSWSLTRAGTTEKVTVSGNLKANGSELLREAAIGGVGLFLIATWLVGEDLAAGRLVPVLEDWTPSPGASEGAIWAVYPPNRRGSKKVACFIDYLERHFGTPPYWDRYTEAARGTNAASG